ncbi:hypothetical protein C4J98_4160 [Pseudomonas orientalis]|uniref:hypothetical protein n=1 Tax=Pseudomonas TaxID=286 RepID=UPI0008122B78|nr:MULTISPECIES: hypothetical protein [Pseudomonas]AZE85545.1 hypothetical protein C4J98_4160 [Pseudomonas orientalis]CRM47955.1 hypothetical protein [Pseudomonas sp. 28 E 9]
MAQSNFCVLDSGGAPYQGVGPAIICYGSFVIANVESPTGANNNGNLSFNHYAVVAELKGFGVGGLGALLFAEHVAKILPNFTALHFDLYRQNPSDNPISLRNAREKLFLSLGATCSHAPTSWHSPPHWIVAVHWDKPHWDHPKKLAQFKQLFLARHEEILAAAAKRKAREARQLKKLKRLKRLKRFKVLSLIKWISTKM